MERLGGTRLRCPLADESPRSVCATRGFEETRTLNEHLKKIHLANGSEQSGIYPITQQQMAEVSRIARQRTKSQRERLLQQHAVFFSDEPAQNMRPIYILTAPQIRSTASVVAAAPREQLTGRAAEYFDATLDQEAIRDPSFRSLPKEQQHYEIRRIWSGLSSALGVMSSFGHLPTSAGGEDAEQFHVANLPAAPNALSGSDSSTALPLAPGSNTEPYISMSAIASQTSAARAEQMPQGHHQSSFGLFTGPQAYRTSPNFHQPFYACMFSSTGLPPASSPENVSTSPWDGLHSELQVDADPELKQEGVPHSVEDAGESV